MGVDTILTNTILMPASDSLVKSNPLPEVTISKEMEAYKTNFNKNETVLVNQFKVFLKTGGQTVSIPYCQSVTKIEVKRGYESQRIGGNAEYMVKLPGPIQYSPVRMVHLVTDNEVFLDWLINSLDVGGIQKADIEIRVGDEKDYMLYTLRDVFPTKWHFGAMSVNLDGLITKDETITYTMKNGDILVENLEVVYSLLEYEHVTGPK